MAGNLGVTSPDLPETLSSCHATGSKQSTSTVFDTFPDSVFLLLKRGKRVGRPWLFPRLGSLGNHVVGDVFGLDGSSMVNDDPKQHLEVLALACSVELEPLRHSSDSLGSCDIVYRRLSA